MSHLADPPMGRRRTAGVMSSSRVGIRPSIVAVVALGAACGGSYPNAAAAPAHATTKADPNGPGPDPTPAGSDDDWGEKPAEPTRVADNKDGKDAKRKPSSPTRQKAEALRNAADLLDKAQDALDASNKDLAEMLFSSAEILTGPEAIAPLAGSFREGAPPRVNAPVVKVEDKGAQPKAAGSSDEDEPVAKPAPAMGGLTGDMKIDGKAAGGAIGFVTLEPVGKKWKPRAPKQRIMEQRNREFAPHVLAIPVGSTVTFPNFDTIFHNVFSRSDAANFDLGLYKQGDARTVTFEKEGVVHLGCNLHANMSAYVVVVAAPHYAITDDSGHFQFKNLDPGKYTLKAWSEKSKAPITQQVVVKAGDNKVEVGVAGDAPSGPQPDKFGASRGGKGW
jgi:plastocyanin